ncbi:MAG: pro-sigmaK processing inhibitor BofA family protein [Lachnospiraceae bacterium]|nr:pro-sigmaK processing inhibitor BofA family protein [Lachnospiraceae bacterium]
MQKETGILIIGGICLLILLVGILKRRAELLLHFLVRLIVGVAGILFLNQFFQNQGIGLYVGLNPISAATVGVLGTGGLAALYGIMALQFL